MLDGFVGLFAAAAVSVATIPAHEADTPEHAVQSFFRALAADDSAALSRLTSPGFYAFDNGKRFIGNSLFELVRNLHRDGTQINWNLSSIDVHQRGMSAWAAWENHGAAGTSGAMTSVTWLESANLHRAGRVWLIDFLNSARAAPPSGPK